MKKVNIYALSDCLMQNCDSHQTNIIINGDYYKDVSLEEIIIELYSDTNTLRGLENCMFEIKTIKIHGLNGNKLAKFLIPKEQFDKCFEITEKSFEQIATNYERKS